MIHDGLHDLSLQIVLRDVPQVAVLIGAGVVAVDLASGTVPAHAAHKGTAGTVELAGQDIVRFRFILCLELTVQFQHGLCPLPKFVVDNGRHGPFNAHIIRFADVHAAIGFVLDDPGNAALVEGVALTGTQTFGVELIYNRGGGFPGGVMLKDEADGGSGLFINDKPFVFVRFQAKGTASADGLPLEGTFSHAAAHLLGQLGRVVFGQRFHHALNDDTFRTGDIGFCGINDLNAVVTQAFLVHGRIIAVPGEAVCFPADHHIECALVAVSNHLLERRTIIGLAADVTIHIFFLDGHIVQAGVGLAVPALALNGLLSLPAAAAVSVIGDQPNLAALVEFSFCHTLSVLSSNRLI